MGYVLSSFGLFSVPIAISVAMSTLLLRSLTICATKIVSKYGKANL